VRSALVVGAAAAVFGSAAYVMLGGWGAVVVSAAITMLAASAARGALPPKPEQSVGRIGSPAEPSFPSYGRITEIVWWSGSNAHYYDTVARPYLAMTAGALLAERRRLALRDRAAAQVFGPAAWSLIDPEERRDVPVHLDALEVLIERLEAL